MDYKRIQNSVIVRIDRGEEVVQTLLSICEKEKIKAGSFVGLGAADMINTGVLDVEKKQFNTKEFTGQMEISSIVGNISTMNGEPYLHTHITFCNEQMQIFGGHLNKCHISGTCEITITIIDGTIERKHDDSVGLNTYYFES